MKRFNYEDVKLILLFGDDQRNSIQKGDKIWFKRHVVESVILWNLCSHEVNLEPTFRDRDRAWIWQEVGSNFRTQNTLNISGV